MNGKGEEARLANLSVISNHQRYSIIRKHTESKIHLKQKDKYNEITRNRIYIYTHTALKVT